MAKKHLFFIGIFLIITANAVIKIQPTSAQNAPSLAITSPIGGETLTKGNVFKISWVQSGLNGVNVRIQLNNFSTDSVSVKDIAVAPASNGSYDWLIPAILSDSSYYKISIKNDVAVGGAVAGGVVDYTDEYFSINGQSVSLILKSEGDPKVYKIIEGKKLWIPTVESFAKQGFAWSQIKQASKLEINQYPRLKLIKTAYSPKIYYITENGIRRHIINPEVFLSYGNKWENIVKVSPVDFEMFTEVNLVRETGGVKVYLLSDGKKYWIKTAEVFNRLGLSWGNIAPVNKTEINAYPEGAPME